MKKICFSFNHFQYSDGIARSAISMANYLSQRKDIEVTLRPIFKIQKEAMNVLNKNIKIKPVLGFYFNGLSKIMRIIPDKFWHDWIFGKNKYDIEIGFQYGTSTRAVVASDNNAKHLIWMHGYDEGLLMKPYYKKADMVVCVSRFNANRLKKELNENINIEYCYNPIDETSVIESGKELISLQKNKKLVFVSVGRLSEEKGYLRLLNVSARLKREGFSFVIWLIGEGPQRTELEEKVKLLKLDDVVKFMGNQANPHKYTSKADIFICSSFSEGYSTACTEAIMLGIPVISTEVSGAKEIIEDAECGKVVENSEEGIYLGMKSILLDPIVVESWKKILLKTKKHFFVEERIDKLEDILGV